MKKKIFAAIAAMALAGTMTTTVPAMAQGGAGGGKHEMGEGRERHPEIQAAIRSLERAKKHMQEANHDFGGHREDALKACDEAIKQLHEALKYDKK